MNRCGNISIWYKQSDHGIWTVHCSQYNMCDFVDNSIFFDFLFIYNNNLAIRNCSAFGCMRLFDMVASWVSKGNKDYGSKWNLEKNISACMWTKLSWIIGNLCRTREKSKFNRFSTGSLFCEQDLLPPWHTNGNHWYGTDTWTLSICWPFLRFSTVPTDNQMARND